MFTSIDVPEPEKRHLSPNELIDFMDYLVQNWGKARFAPTMLKLFFWSAARREEIAGLKWSDLREAHGQYHFFWRANGA
jgi:integrase